MHGSAYSYRCGVRLGLGLGLRVRVRVRVGVRFKHEYITFMV
jgi:hypothetical protein